jgi:ketosteroid isomerase-like protein
MSDPTFTNYTASLDDLFRDGDLKAPEKVEEAANVRLIQELMLAIGRNDAVALGDLLTDDVELDIRTSVDLPFIRRAKGKEQFLEAVWKNFGELQDQQPNLEAVIAQGDTVIILAQEQGELRKTSARYQIQGMHRYVFREGKIALVQELILPA